MANLQLEKLADNIFYFFSPEGPSLICETDKQSEVIALGFWFLHGSRDEVDGERGLAHFLEHMVFKGTAKRTAFQLSWEIERLGGVINGGTEKEFTSFYVTVPKEFWEIALDVLCDLSFAATLDQNELIKEKLVVENEISSIEDSAEEKGYELFLSQIWGNHSLARKITGEPTDIKEITRSNIERFYRQFFTPSRLLVVASGGFQQEELAEQLTRKIDYYTKGISFQNIFRKREKPVFYSGLKIIKDHFKQAQIYYARNLPNPKCLKDFYIQLIISSAFGEAMSSRLFQRIREAEGLCYSIYSARSYFEGASLLTVHATTFPFLVLKLGNALGRELLLLKQQGLSPEEIEDTKLQAKGSLILARQDAELRMKRLARQYLIMKKILPYEECLTILNSITQEEILEHIDLLFAEEKEAVLLYGSRNLKNTDLISFLSCPRG